ncbi:type II secretion system protein [Halomicronema hongdechloris]|nr:prepilin-type N-terminal cleavage/methylation domain-containing protein [Halomicronema hongdechloris]
MVYSLLIRAVARRPSSTSGFTLLEVLISMVIMGVLAALIYPTFMDMSRRAHYGKAKQAMGSVSKDLQLYRLENGQYPPEVAANVKPEGVINWPQTVPYDSSLDYDHWRVGGGRCYVQISFLGESNQKAYTDYQENVPPPAIQKFDDNLVFGVDSYECGLSGQGNVE